MPNTPRTLLAALLLTAVASAASSQTSSPATDRMIRMSGALPVVAGQPAVASASVDFAIYDAESGGSLLWQETHVLAVAANGAYTVLLGASTPEGLPADLFAGGVARWLSVSRTGTGGGPRTLLTAVPYAMSAVNAETLSGRPATDFMLVPSARSRSGSGTAGAGSAAATEAASRDPEPLVNNGTANFIGKFFNNVDLINSQLFDNGANVGVGTTNPIDKFHVQFTNSTGSQTGLAVQNLSGGANAYSGMLFYDHTGALRQFQGYNNSTGEYRINNISPTASINFLLGGTSRFLMQAGTGNVGISEPSPSYRLDVLHGGSTGVRVRSSASFSVVDIDANSGDAALRFVRAGANQWNIRNNPSNDDLQIFELGGGGERMRIENGTGYIQVSATDAAGRLIVGPLANSPGNLSVSGDGNVLQGVAMLDRLNDDGTLIRFRRNGTTQGTIDVAAGVVSYNAFTGSHFARTDEVIERGMLVSLTGQNGRLEDNPESEILYGVRKSQRANDPGVMGAYLARQNVASANLSESVNPHLVEAVGNGEMWVVDTGRSLVAGDYLLSSAVPGHAMVDPGTFDTSNIIARLAAPIDWSTVTDTVQGADGRAHKRVLASVFFESFVIDRTSKAEIKALNERIAALEAALRALTTTTVQQQR